MTTGFGDRGDDRRVRHIGAVAALDSVEIGFPLRPDAVGGDQILFVEVLDVGGVGAELGGLGKLLQETVHSGITLGMSGSAEENTVTA